MIMDKETFKEYGYWPSDLTHGSGKPIFALCDDCGKIRVLLRCCYRPLCKACSAKGRKLTEETKAKISLVRTLMSAAKKGRKLTEEKKSKMSAIMKGKYVGEKSSNWKGGISFEPYCEKFNESYKREIRNLFGNECFLCGKSTEENGKALSVHHVNYNKNCGCDDTKCICVPLCHNCHIKTNFNRDFWEALMIEMLKPLEAWSN